MRRAVSDGVLPTRTPTASSASCLAAAVPAEPDTIAPACPLVFPSGAGNPAPHPPLAVAADLTDHHDHVGVGVVLEGGQAVDVGRPDNRVAADPDRGRET